MTPAGQGLATHTMLTSAYRLYSRYVLAAALLVFPWLAIQSESLPANNNLETWLPAESEVRTSYQGFTQQFGAEELILVGLVNRKADDPLVEAIAARLEALDGVRHCWTPSRLAAVMSDLGVPADEIEGRLRGLTIAHDGRVTGLIAMLSEKGVQERAATVADVRRTLSYCQIGEEEILLSGAPVVVAELDRLGSTRANKRFFLSTFLISGLLLYYILRDARLAAGIVAITLWSVVATNTLVKFCGGEMNFILSALPVMVLIFTLSIAVHFLHYYRSCLGRRDPVGDALRSAIRPCFWATLTTVIGLLSLMVSEIAPVRQFGWAASIGAVVAMASALLLTPALVMICPGGLHHESAPPEWASRWGIAIIARRWPIIGATAALVIITATGIPQLHSKVDPVEFLPKGSGVVNDLLRVEKELTPAESIEAIVDFGIRDLPFTEKLRQVRQIESEIAAQPGVKHTISLATFFPSEMPDNTFAAMRILGKASAQSKAGQNDFVSAGERFWRISARVTGSPDAKFKVYQDLQKLSERHPITFTGLAPLLAHAQRIIFDGFWESFASAFLIITGVMVVSLRSFKVAMVAMLPNVAPISIVFGLMGLFDIPVDIGMMMTASIGLGIAVDGTFHFIMQYRESFRHHGQPARAARAALFKSGPPISQAALIASIGMLALTVSQFTPTVRFGLLMASLLLVALLGDLFLLPALLAVSPARKRNKATELPAGEALAPNAAARNTAKRTEAQAA